MVHRISSVNNQRASPTRVKGGGWSDQVSRTPIGPGKVQSGRAELHQQNVQRRPAIATVFIINWVLLLNQLLLSRLLRLCVRYYAELARLRTEAVRDYASQGVRHISCLIYCRYSCGRCGVFLSNCTLSSGQEEKCAI